MKTRQEMIYDFMLALAANPAITESRVSLEAAAKDVYLQAAALADKVLENL
jgi:hypothetical protein